MGNTRASWSGQPSADAIFLASSVFDVPGGPTVARIADPEGNQIGLVQQ